MILLSVLIPTIRTRKQLFTRLMSELIFQREEMRKAGYPDEIELLYDDRAAYLEGGPSIGKKREALVQRAQGKYLCFVDDDEFISPEYLVTLYQLCQHRKDIITFRNISFLSNYWMMVDFSLHHPGNEEATPEKIVLRRPWHICPVRSKYAKQYPFEDISYAEDWPWMQKVLTHCRTEAKTDKILHQYNHGKHSEADRIVQYEKLLAEQRNEKL